jgi:hypothetical protein
MLPRHNLICCSVSQPAALVAAVAPVARVHADLRALSRTAQAASHQRQPMPMLLFNLMLMVLFFWLAFALVTTSSLICRLTSATSAGEQQHAAAW